jgi:uncharacterized protein YpbB
MAREQGLAQFQILHQQVLIQIVVNLPGNRTDLKKIKGVGKKTLEKYGQYILALVAGYRKNHDINRVKRPDATVDSGKSTSPEKSASGSNTRQISFDMFSRGLSLARIAEERGLVESTIQKHLCFFVEKGNLDINRLLSPEKQKAIESALSQSTNPSLKAVKQAIGDHCTYGDIKLVLAHQKHLVSK